MEPDVWESGWFRFGRAQVHPDNTEVIVGGAS